MSQDALRVYEAKARTAELAQFGTEEQPMLDDTPDDGIDDDGNDTLTGQSMLSTWKNESPWAQDPISEGTQVAASGYGEAALTVGSGLVASVPAGLAGLVELARGNGMEEAAKTIEGVQEWLTYLPKTPEGQKALEQLVPLLSKLSAPSEAVGGAVFDATGSPAAATAAEVVLDPLNFAVPAGALAAKAGVKGAAKVVKRAAHLPAGPVSGSPRAQLGSVGDLSKNSPASLEPFGLHYSGDMGDIVLTESAKNPGQYQLTMYDGKLGKSNPVRDEQFKTATEAIKAFEEWKKK